MFIVLALGSRTINTLRKTIAALVAAAEIPPPSISLSIQSQFLDHFRERFIVEVDATAIALELEHRGVISNGDQLTISLNKDAAQQNQLLHACLKKKCNAKALTDVCDVITMVKGNPKMKSFGENMKMEWEKGVCCHCVWCVSMQECM